MIDFTRGLCAKLLPFLYLLSTPYMLWKLVSVLSNTSHPGMVVLSESMAPAFHRGDVILIWNRTDAFRVGDIPVCWFDGQPMPMVHRVVQVHYASKDTGAEMT
jgi:signal peptidase